MKHITDEQFEDILEGRDVDFAHLRACRDCRDRLAEKRAISRRLRSAFGSVQAGPDLADRIRGKFGSTVAASMPREPVKSVSHSRHHRQLWSALAAAAAILVVLVPLSVYFGTPSAAKAAQAELVKIHNHNLAPDHEFYSEAEPENLAEYFKTKLGFNPRLPELGHGMALRGCCVKHFRGEVVGSYVVDTPQGVMSVIVVTDKPESLGIEGEFKKNGQTYWKSSFAKCDMVSVRIGDYSYCAVGEISHDYLTELLSRLLPETQE